MESLIGKRYKTKRIRHICLLKSRMDTKPHYVTVKKITDCCQVSEGLVVDSIDSARGLPPERFRPGGAANRCRVITNRQLINSNMKNRIASYIAAFAILAFGAASCDILDPWDPGDGGGNGGGNGGGRDTVCDNPKDTNIWDPWDPNDTIIWDNPNDSNWFPRDSNGHDGNHDDDDIAFIRGEGTVVWVPIEGGFWGIESSDGHEYEPLNLPQEFMVNGLKVGFHGQLMKNWASMYQWGTVLQIGEIYTL